MKPSPLAILLSLYLITTSGAVFATTVCDGTLQHPCIVQDTKENSTKVKNYRDTFMVNAAYHGNKLGLEQLWASASATPNQNDLKSILKMISDSTNGKVKKILDIDLREESHGLVNDQAISLDTEHNWINLGKTHQQTISDEQSWLQSLGKEDKIKNVLTSDQFDAKEFDKGVDIKIKSLKTEEEAAEKLGYEYIRLTVSDHMAPNSIETDRFVSIVRNLNAGTWVHIHCHGGKGRATTFMAMYDMLQNADKVAFDDIIKRQAAVEPFYDLYHTDHSNPDLTYYYQERLKFLKHFYQFANDYRRGYTGNWSTWMHENNIS